MNIVIIIATAVFVVASFKRLRLSPVLGYFVAGGLLGENGFNIVTSKETEFFGEIGVIFLLFAIGLELTFERLKSMRKHVFGFGSLQVLLSAILIGGIAYLLESNISSAIIIGGGLALSSTAIVLQVISDNGEQSTQLGRLSLSILLLQDFAVVPLLVIIPILAGEHSSISLPLFLAFIKAVSAIVIIFVVGRLCLRPLYRVISTSRNAKTNELFIATTLLIALGTAWITQSLGLSMALGAFAAGLLVAETEFQLQAEESISPFKSLLLGLFFMSVGMALDLKAIYAQLPIITVLSFGLVVLKTLIIVFLCVLFGFRKSVAIRTGLLLSQSGEFAFILFRLADNKGIIDNAVGQILLLVVTITMAFTPLIAVAGKWLAFKIDPDENFIDKQVMHQEIIDLGDHVIIVGSGKVGKMVSKILAAENTNYLLIDIDSEHVAEQRQRGIPVYLGDGSTFEMLTNVGAERASAIIVAIDNKVTTLKISRLVKTYFPKLSVIVRSKDLSDCNDYNEAGADKIVPECYETGLQLGGAVLNTIGFSELEISRIKNEFRSNNYTKLPEVDNSENNSSQSSNRE